MEYIKQILEYLFSGISLNLIIHTAFRILIVLILAWIGMKLIVKALRRLEKNLINKSQADGEPPSESEKRIETIIRLLRQGSLIAVWITAGIIILKELGVEIGPIIASAGIVGLAVGFGAQNLVRDIISGFFMILENQIRVGDVAIINGTAGLVEKIKFRTTVLRDVSGTVHTFPNGTITTLSNMTNEWSAYVFEIGVAYKEDTDNVISVMEGVGESLLKDEKFGKFIMEKPEIYGVDKLADSAVIIKGRIKTKPIRQWIVGREYLRRIKYAFDQQGIEIPFPHQTLYFGSDSKPFNVELLNKYAKESSPTEP
jgi:small conductance mechanosensitive channel